jgi:predicted nucleic acid-binding protein
MSRPVFDTNVLLSYRTRIPESDQIKMALSTVVLYELTATTIDKSEWQRYDALRRAHHKNGTLLTPNRQDWWETAKLVSRIRFQDKRDARGLTPPLAAPDRLQNDALIARAAHLRQYFIVTSNLKDFAQIQQFLPVKVVSATDYFGF